MVKKRGQINLLIYLTPFLNHVFFFKVSHLVSNLFFRPIRKPYFPKKNEYLFHLNSGKTQFSNVFTINTY